MTNPVFSATRVRVRKLWYSTSSTLSFSTCAWELPAKIATSTRGLVSRDSYIESDMIQFRVYNSRFSSDTLKRLRSTCWPSSCWFIQGPNLYLQGEGSTEAQGRSLSVLKWMTGISNLYNLETETICSCNSREMSTREWLAVWTQIKTSEWYRDFTMYRCVYWNKKKSSIYFLITYKGAFYMPTLRSMLEPWPLAELGK